MEMKKVLRNREKLGWRLLALLTLMACGIMITLSYAQSEARSSFNLNSPASFPIDI